MTDKRILEVAVMRAISHGCPYSFVEITMDEWIEHKYYYSAIFDHEFAKAFWGEKDVCCLDGLKRVDWLEAHRAEYGSRSDRERAWKYQWKCKCYEYHLKKMVVEKEPLKYLEKFL